jgi:serine/threonine protein kinase
MLGCAQAAAAELGWNRRLNMALEAAKGMLYLHSRADAVLHRDLKSANLLVDKHWRVKVADFNLSRVMNASAVVSSVSATNPRYGSQPLLADLSRAWVVQRCWSLSQSNDFGVRLMLLIWKTQVLLLDGLWLF